MRRLLLPLLVVACRTTPEPPEPPVPSIPAWESALPDDAVMQAARGFSAQRGIVHLHSPFSHDACDGEPLDANGLPREDCATDLRDALCETQMSYAMLTDHDDSMADQDFAAPLFQVRQGDELINDEVGRPFAARLHCSDGHTVLLFVGGENDLMPLALHEHPPGDLQTRHDIYNANDLSAIETYRALGGLAWVAHSESKELPLLRELQLDGMEIFNLHAVLDPDIREDFLGLPAGDGIQAIFPFLSDGSDNAPEPDLTFLAFFDENRPSLARWETLLSEGFRISGSAGTDAHQNALPITFQDGERGDSYRRMMRWFSNVALVEHEGDPTQMVDALRQGRFFVAFEAFGTPQKFDFHAERDEVFTELGGEVTAGQGLRLVLKTPSVALLDSRLPAPEIAAKILRVENGGSVEVAQGSGAISLEEVPVGVYRAEVHIRPRHLGPYLGSLGPSLADKDVVWIYSNPIYVRP